ncbi:YfjI family protein [Flavilitoribacter nigricans]|uniref:DUF3987 domain-containing protein n=1 Tax=Flavilitoribacter nigricans (strain ATCC 23147 / DSM 23189 / NBRC 102662 / NCIMB 1420 / SS-2) TaxID=1122177 RepID=A0A2D0MY14_FLAN2|nr:YfjI family protein [Flavilitoribacter nigricans]PHN01154.1 hypothetical protein CRP01_38775 [Flavilitoribacter nigricans DSM 23189 = NBRC 102662]
MKEFTHIKISKKPVPFFESTTLIEPPMETKPFPINVFPDVVKAYIEESTECLNLVPDFIGVGVLSAVASLIGNSYRIQIKKGWTERPILWLAIVGYSGIRKTPSLDAAILPLQKIDKSLYLQYCEELENHKSQLEAADQEKPLAKQLIVTDSTIEALIPILKQNPNGILYFKDELISWINDLTRYNRGSAEQQWLSLYSNQPIRLNRKTDDDNFRVDSPFANVLGGIQPGILSNLFEDGRGINGFTSRIAFSFPEPIKRKVSYTTMAPLVAEDYENFIHRFLHLQKAENNAGQIEPITLEFSYPAQDKFYEWNETFINQPINDPNTSEAIKSALSKMEALMPKLALIMQFIENVGNQQREPKVVEIDAVNKAIELTDYFYAHLLKVFREVGLKTSNVESRELLLLKSFSSQFLDGQSKEAAIKNLLADGFANFEISKALSVPKSSVHYWSKK